MTRFSLVCRLTRPLHRTSTAALLPSKIYTSSRAVAAGERQAVRRTEAANMKVTIITLVAIAIPVVLVLGLSSGRDIEEAEAKGDRSRAWRAFDRWDLRFHAFIVLLFLLIILGITLFS